MKAMVVREAGGPFTLDEHDIPEPRTEEIRIKVEACGICHSDAFVKFVRFAGFPLPQIEHFPLEAATVMENTIRFRAVLDLAS